MTFYEKSKSNTLIARLMEPLDEQTTYAVIITRRLKDAEGKAVGSPFDFINHTAQSEELWPLLQVMPEGLTVEDIAYTLELYHANCSVCFCSDSRWTLWPRCSKTSG